MTKTKPKVKYYGSPFISEYLEDHFSQVASTEEADFCIFGSGFELSPLFSGCPRTMYPDREFKPTWDKTLRKFYLRARLNGKFVVGIGSAASLIHVVNGGNVYFKSSKQVGQPQRIYERVSPTGLVVNKEFTKDFQHIPFVPNQQNIILATPPAEKKYINFRRGDDMLKYGLFDHSGEKFPTRMDAVGFLGKDGNTLGIEMLPTNKEKIDLITRTIDKILTEKGVI